jgi:putative Holliday junction resolvase
MKYIGVAVGQSLTKTASPLASLAAKDGIPKWEELDKLMSKWQPEALVVGIPLNMDGSKQEVTFCAKAFAKRLKIKYALPVHEVDERLSTWEAKRLLFQGAQGKKAKHTLQEIDSIAAVILLEQWLNDNFSL